MTIKTFENPVNGHKETDGGRFCWLWCFLFSGLYFAFRGNWGWFFISYLLVLPTLFTSYLIVPFFARKINRTHLLRKGYREVV